MAGTLALRRMLRKLQTILVEQLDTDSSEAVRLMASAIRGAIDSVRMLAAFLTASVAVEVGDHQLSLEEAMRAAAPNQRPPWEI